MSHAVLQWWDFHSPPGQTTFKEEKCINSKISFGENKHTPNIKQQDTSDMFMGCNKLTEDYAFLHQCRQLQTFPKLSLAPAQLSKLL